jgi:hypothetical protein
VRGGLKVYELSRRNCGADSTTPARDARDEFDEFFAP